jgi:hypothetical protein
MIAPQVLDMMNELAGKLGYMPVDDDWGNSAPPADLRLPAGGAGGAAVAAAAALASAPDGDGPVFSQALGARLREGLARTDAGAFARWEPHSRETMVAVSIGAAPGQPAEHWLVDLKNRTVSLADRAARENSDWDVVGSAAAWDRVIEGELNLSVALRAAQLRYCDGDESGNPLLAETRMAILASLLGLTRWPGANPASGPRQPPSAL